MSWSTRATTIATSCLLLGLSLSAAGAEKRAILHYNFDEGRGAALNDLSGAGNDGAIRGKPQWVAGRFGKALAFDGRSTFVDCGRHKSLNITGDVTLEAWVKGPGGITRFQGIISKMTRFGRGYSLAKANNYFTFSVGDGTYRYLYSDNRYTDTDWHHVVGTRRGGTNNLYVDGVRQKRTNTFPIVDSAQKLVIGAFYSDADLYYTGAIDHVKVYNGALTEAEILQHYIHRPRAQREEELPIVQDGKPSAVIVIPDARDHWDTTAAGWLTDYVARSTGVKLRTVIEADAPQARSFPWGTPTWLVTRVSERTTSSTTGASSSLAAGCSISSAATRRVSRPKR